MIWMVPKLAKLSLAKMNTNLTMSNKSLKGEQLIALQNQWKIALLVSSNQETLLHYVLEDCYVHNLDRLIYNIASNIINITNASR